MHLPFILPTFHPVGSEQWSEGEAFQVAQHLDTGMRAHTHAYAVPEASREPHWSPQMTTPDSNTLFLQHLSFHIQNHLCGTWEFHNSVLSQGLMAQF